MRAGHGNVCFEAMGVLEDVLQTGASYVTGLNLVIDGAFTRRI